MKEDILKIKKSAIKKVEEEIEETYDEHKKMLNIFLLLLLDYFYKYSKGNKFSVNRYERQSILRIVKEKIIKEINELSNIEIEFNKRVLEEIITDVYEQHSNLFENGKKLNTLFIQELIKKYYKGDNLENRILRNKRKLAAKIYGEFDKGLTNHSELGEATKSLNEVFKNADYESYRILKNEQGRIFDAIQVKIFIDLLTVKEVTWVSTLCENTCTYCEMMDGSLFSLNDPDRPEIPAHVLCQCCWVPI